MDSSTGQSQPSAAPSSGPGQREMMFCHECHDEWYRDERGIICPECGSEFTEIIEDDNDPRDNAMFGHEHDDDDDSIPSLEEAPPTIPTHPLADHNPWRDDDPEDSDISSMRFQPIGPGRFHVSATIHRTISPAQFGPGGGNGPNTLGAFTSFLSNMLQGTGAGGGARPPGQQQNQTGDDQGNPQSRSGADGQPHVHRFTYTGGARLHPRDANNPGPRLEPVDNLNDVLAGLFAALGEPPGGRPGGHTHGLDDMPMNPLMGLFAAMSGGQHGDAVYSQEALDRIISQLMEQTATSNAPGPATQNDINSLPRRKVTEDMLGAEHRAECSICMDEVNIGEEVTELPCKHWFHHQCVAAWLSEHDTCPHCRKGISKPSEGSPNNPAAGNASPPGADPTASMPGAFGVSGAGTFNNPFIVPGSSALSQNQGPAQGGAPGGSSSGNGGGLGERLRRGLFGPHRN